MVTTSTKKSLIDFRFNSIYPYFKPYESELIIRNSIELEFDDLLELGDLEVCKKRHAFFKESGGAVEDFREKILDLGNNKFALVGIRFKGLNINKPFVSAWTNFLNITDEDLKLISNEFKMFNPRHISIDLPVDKSLEMKSTQKDYLVIGDLKKLANIEFKSKRVSLELAEELNFYEEYSQEYDIFHKANPELALEVKKESSEDLEESIQDKVLYKILVDGKCAGIMAGRVEDKYGVKGLCVLEKVLFSKYRKQGFGHDFQQLFINEMAKRDFKIIWGTIYHENYSSLKTAISTGRQVVQTSYFLPIL